MFGAKKSDINTPLFHKIDVLNEQFDSLPDGAFIGVMAENGVEPEDLGWYQEVKDLNGI